MQNKTKTTILILLIILPVLIIFLIRQFLQPNYIISSLYKIIFLAPIIYHIFIYKKTLKQAISENFSFKRFKKNLMSIVIIGFIFALIYLLAFLFFKNYLELETIVTGLGQLASININNIILIGLYIIIFNSLLEEFFWRGLIFKELGKLMKPYKVHTLTGIGFSLHHMVFYYNWFGLALLALVTLGLIFYSISLNFVFRKYKDLFACWLVHASVDIIQIYIALNIFGIL